MWRKNEIVFAALDLTAVAETLQSLNCLHHASMAITRNAEELVSQ